ncbi:MAG TPA: response regulator [Myxococcota bacterium]|nr:response regulator [Myxococcota bacterium]
MTPARDAATGAIIHVVDDDDAFRAAMARLLRVAGYEVKEYRSAGDYLLEPPSDGSGCLLLDLHMPGPDGLELQEAVLRRGDALPVVFLTGHGDIRSSVRAMRQGAADFLTKPVNREQLLAAIGAALERQEREQSTSRWRRELAARYATLSPREKQVLEGIVTGALNKQIAALLGTSERTIKAHRSKIMQKMRVASVAELVLASAALRPRAAGGRPPD